MTLLRAGLGMLFLLMLAGCASQMGSSKEQAAHDHELAKIYTDMGLAYFRRGELDRAQERLEKAVELNDQDPATVQYLGEVLSRLGKPKEAEKHYRNALKLTPDEPNLQNNFAAFLCSQGNYDEAEVLFDKVIANPTYATPYAALENAGRCIMRKGDKVKAEEYFAKALRLQPKLPNSLFHMAELQYDRANHMKARAFFERYLEVGAESAEVLFLGYKIEKQLGDADMARQYADKLVKGYRDSEQTERMREMERDAQKTTPKE